MKFLLFTLLFIVAIVQAARSSDRPPRVPGPQSTHQAARAFPLTCQTDQDCGADAKCYVSEDKEGIYSKCLEIKYVSGGRCDDMGARYPRRVIALRSFFRQCNVGLKCVKVDYMDNFGFCFS